MFYDMLRCARPSTAQRAVFIVVVRSMNTWQSEQTDLVTASLLAESALDGRRLLRSRPPQGYMAKHTQEDRHKLPPAHQRK